MRDRALILGRAGLRVDTVVALSEQVYDDRLAGRLWDGTRRLAQRHLDSRGRGVARDRGARRARRDHRRPSGFSGALGTVAEVRDGAWTGDLVGTILHGPAKAGTR